MFTIKRTYEQLQFSTSHKLAYDARQRYWFCLSIKKYACHHRNFSDWSWYINYPGPGQKHVLPIHNPAGGIPWKRTFSHSTFYINMCIIMPISMCLMCYVTFHYILPSLHYPLDRKTKNTQDVVSCTLKWEG